MHERADTAKGNISARRRFPATNVPEVRRHGDAVLGRIRRPPRRVKTRSRQKPRKDRASDGRPAGGWAGQSGPPGRDPGRRPEPSAARGEAALPTVAAKPELATAPEGGEQGLGRISG